MSENLQLKTLEECSQDGAKILQEPVAITVL